MALIIDCLKRSSVTASTSERGRKLWADMTPTPLHAGDVSPQFAMPLQDIQNQHRRGENYQKRKITSSSTATTTITTSFLEAADSIHSTDESTDLSDEEAHGLPVSRGVSPESNLSSWAVKNTFINLQDEADPSSPCALPKRYISAPVLLSPTVDDDSDDYLSATMDYPSEEDSATLRASKLGGEAVAGGYPSIGSMEHHLGNCKPCAWFYKPQGCENGVECRHCHACAKGEIRRRKKERLSKGKNSDEQQ